MIQTTSWSSTHTPMALPSTQWFGSGLRPQRIDFEARRLDARLLRRGAFEHRLAGAEHGEQRHQRRACQQMSLVEPHRSLLPPHRCSAADVYFDFVSASTTCCILSRRCSMLRIAAESSHSPSAAVRPGSSSAFILSHSSASTWVSS